MSCMFINVFKDKEKKKPPQLELHRTQGIYVEGHTCVLLTYYSLQQKRLVSQMIILWYLRRRRLTMRRLPPSLLCVCVNILYNSVYHYGETKIR